MPVDKTERLKVLIYEYFFFNEAEYNNKIITLSNSYNYRKPDINLLYQIYNAKVQQLTFDKVMTDILGFLSHFD